MKNKLYLENIDIFNDKVNKSYLIKEKANVVEIENAILLPPKKVTSNSLNGIYSGGVVTDKFDFVSGLTRHDHHINYSVLESYTVLDDEIEKRNEEVIFGGILLPAFGHVILESLSRLWYVIKKKKDKRKIVFLKTSQISQFHYEFFRLLGIDEDRIEIIDKPTKFLNVIVPDETIYAWYGYKKEYNLIYDKIRENVTPKNVKKIYFTRTKLEPKFDVNEEFFEDFYKKRGYEIISPETLSVEEQIAYASGADEIVTTMGSLSHFALFMDYNKKIVILNRKKDNVLVPQFIINEARKHNAIYIDAMLELLPIEHAYGCVCLYPNMYFKQYLLDEKIKFKENELNVNKNEIIVDYITSWCNNYNNPIKFVTIQSADTFDFLNCLSKVFLGISSSKKELYPKNGEYKTKKFWIKRNNEQKIEIADLNKKITSLSKKNLESTKKIETLLKDDLELNKKFDFLSKDNANLNKKIKNLSRENDVLKEKIKELLKENNNINKKYKKIVNSKSWEITKPLRKLSKKLTKLRIKKSH